MRRRLITFAIVLVLASGGSARDREIRPVEIEKEQFRAYNIGLTGFFTLVTAVIQGEVDSPGDAVRHFLIGSGAGISYYHAKRMAGAGRTTEGWLLTNLTASVVENTTSGEHPLGRIGYTIGPFRLRVATPFERKAVATVEADWSLAETTYLIMALREGDRVRLRDGLIAVDRNTPWPDPDDDDAFFYGRNFGVFPGISPGVAPVVWNHEVVHAIQNQQMDSVEPPVYTFGGDRDPPARRLFLFRHVRAGFTHIANYPTYERPYEERWLEVEAYGLAERRPVR